MCTARFPSSVGGGAAQPSPGCIPFGPIGRPLLAADPPPHHADPLDAGYVISDACWEVNPLPPVNRQTGVKKLHSRNFVWRAVINRTSSILRTYSHFGS